MSIRLLLWSLLALNPILAVAQAPPPPPAPLAALGEPTIPAGNPQSDAKVALGAALFWDEQLSRTGTVACGTCHRPGSAGADPRSDVASASNPGPDDLFDTDDDVIGSPGVAQHDADGNLVSSSAFALEAQVGGRNAPSAIDAAFFDELFWDGRAASAFVDPDSGATLIASGGALENQALGPVVNTAEMAHLEATLDDVLGRIERATPLLLASDVPTSLSSWIAGRDYPALFAEVFGDSEISAARFALAVAAYERTLIANQTPLDDELNGTPSLTGSEAAGRTVFETKGCLGCHGGALLADGNFHYIGVRPAADDLGRFAETGDNRDRGAMKTPSLRNAELGAPYFHNGRFATLEDVIDFYDRGGDFDAPNKAPAIQPLNLTAQQKSDLAAFLRRPLTDPRVAAESGPFARPTLYTESERVPTDVADGRVGSTGRAPRLVMLEPPLAGSDNFTVGIEDAPANAAATLVVDLADPGLVDTTPDSAALAIMALTTDADGTASLQLPLPSSTRWTRAPLYARVYVADAGASAGLAITQAVRFTPFAPATTIMRDGFD